VTCAASDVAVSVASDRPRYGPGDTVRITSTVVDRSPRPCTILTRCAPPDVFGTFEPSPGAPHSLDYYESRQSRPCSDNVTQHLLQPGRPSVQQETAPASLPRGGPGCGDATVQLTAQVFVIGADQFFHAVQATSGFGISAPCPSASPRRGPLG
jgi:hypothetical protein